MKMYNESMIDCEKSMRVINVLSRQYMAHYSILGMSIHDEIRLVNTKHTVTRLVNTIRFEPFCQLGKHWYRYVELSLVDTL